MNKLLFIPVFVFLFLIITCQDNPGEPDQNDSLWPVAQPETQNMSPQLLDSALTRAQSSGFIDGLLVIRNGYIVAERYYNGHDRLQPHNVMSVSKSFLSAITGIALDHLHGARRMEHGVLHCGCRNLRLQITAPCPMPFAPCKKTLHCALYQRKYPYKLQRRPPWHLIWNSFNLSPIKSIAIRKYPIEKCSVNMPYIAMARWSGRFVTINFS